MARGGEELAAYLGNPAQTAYFVFVEQSVDKRNRLYKAATVRGRAIEFKASLLFLLCHRINHIKNLAAHLSGADRFDILRRDHIPPHTVTDPVPDHETVQSSAAGKGTEKQRL